MSGWQRQPKPGFTSKTNRLLYEDDDEQGSIADRVKNHQRVSGIPHEEENPQALDVDPPRHTRNLKPGGICIGLQDKGEGAGHIHQENRADNDPRKPQNLNVGFCVSASLHIFHQDLFLSQSDCWLSSSISSSMHMGIGCVFVKR